ncbi:hypothetical protein CAEBREN_03382 [Caenorhabditis brenneri]|uniref:G-protein coupled receptors family 1 profile domain-containing protein n=1 Tax=Caenorhabditis brenneri TaxID=135651 RepID=G0NEF4_CAEBE|nr:hypothetical protein CAEBREN_03382 [Caenorhabditis brenneri]
MITTVVIVGSTALALSLATFILNSKLLLSIFWYKRVQRNADMTLIYSRFAVDMVYALASTINMVHLVTRAILPDATIKNLSFFTNWPVFNLGTIRLLLVFFITLDRIVACYLPIFYRNHRSKLPNLILLPLILSYTAFEHFILFNLCGFVLDIPLSCLGLACSLTACYRDYWLHFEEYGYLCIGVLTLILCTRLFIWNHFSKIPQRKQISRVHFGIEFFRKSESFQTTQISLLDACIIFTFDVIPAYLFAHVPAINFQSFGPMVVVSKNLGFVIEAFITFWTKSYLICLEMSVVGDIVTVLALIFSGFSFLANLYLILSIFVYKKVQRKPEMTLIYSRFAVDMLFSLINSASMMYVIIRTIFPDAIVKNLSFFIVWPTLNLGTIRFFLVLLITLDRIFATCLPISYRKHRSRIPNFIFLASILCYTGFEHFILFKICDFTLDVPMGCASSACSINTCYRNYWLYFEQIGYFSIGVLSLILCFRLFIWNYFSRAQQKKEISRTTRISLLDTCIIFMFNATPTFLFSRFPAFNVQNVGPLSACCKNFGFVIEAFILCRVLIVKKPMLTTVSSSRISKIAT